MRLSWGKYLSHLRDFGPRFLVKEIDIDHTRDFRTPIPSNFVLDRDIQAIVITKVGIYLNYGARLVRT